MGQIDLVGYKNIYLKTAKEYINSLLLGYNKLVSDSQDKDAVNQIHIDSHSLRSQSQVMGFVNMASLSEIIEKFSRDILNGVAQIDNEFLVLLKNSVDELNLKLTQIEKTQ